MAPAKELSFFNWACAHDRSVCMGCLQKTETYHCFASAHNPRQRNAGKFLKSAHEKSRRNFGEFCFNCRSVRVLGNRPIPKSTKQHSLTARLWEMWGPPKFPLLGTFKEAANRTILITPPLSKTSLETLPGTPSHESQKYEPFEEKCVLLPHNESSKRSSAKK